MGMIAPAVGHFELTHLFIHLFKGTYPVSMLHQGTMPQPRDTIIKCILVITKELTVKWGCQRSKEEVSVKCDKCHEEFMHRH